MTNSLANHFVKHTSQHSDKSQNFLTKKLVLHVACTRCQPIWGVMPDQFSVVSDQNGNLVVTNCLVAVFSNRLYGPKISLLDTFQSFNSLFDQHSTSLLTVSCCDKKSKKAHNYTVHMYHLLKSRHPQHHRPFHLINHNINYCFWMLCFGCSNSICYPAFTKKIWGYYNPGQK